MMLWTRITAILLLLIAVLAYSSVYTVNEGQQALLLQLGQIVTNAKGQPAVQGPGLHFKIPLINQVRIFDTRLHTWDVQAADSQASRIVTAEKKDVLVDYYFKWRISDLALYFTRTGGNPERAETLLEQQLNDSLRAEFGRRTISEVVSDDRIDIMAALQQQANASAKQLGVQVVDVRIKRIDLPTEVSAAIYDRMRAERERIATEHRAQGRANAEAIRAAADANVTVTVATAKANASQIRGTGDAAAAAIYAAAYAKDPAFYEFYRSLEIYRTSFNTKNNILVIKPQGQLFKYFESDGSKTDNSSHNP